VNPFHIVEWSCVWWMRTSQTSSLLASKVMNFLGTTAWSGNCYFTVNCQYCK